MNPSDMKPLQQDTLCLQCRYLGGWPASLAMTPSGNPAVLDCTCELPRMQKNLPYLNLPVWDTHGMLHIGHAHTSCPLFLRLLLTRLELLDTFFRALPACHGCIRFTGIPHNWHDAAIGVPSVLNSVLWQGHSQRLDPSPCSAAPR